MNRLDSNRYGFWYRIYRRLYLRRRYQFDHGLYHRLGGYRAWDKLDRIGDSLEARLGHRLKESKIWTSRSESR
jgi:hypothetical protein